MNIRKNFGRAIATTLLPVASLAAAQTTQEPETQVKGFLSMTTILLKAENPSIDDSNTAHFTVRLTPESMALYPTSSKLVLVFDDAALKQKVVQCPVIDSTGRPRKIKEVKELVLQWMPISPQMKSNVSKPAVALCFPPSRQNLT
jgi:hypothetical protein